MGFVVRGYGRASTDGQVASTAQQESVIQDAFNAYKRFKPAWQDAVWGGFAADEATSRVSTFRERHAASLLLAACQPGDLILVSNYDRIFASIVDVVETLEMLRERKVGLIILDSDIDTSTIIGDFCFKILALVKEMEVKEIRRRTREAMAYRKRVGKPTGNHMVGWTTTAYRTPGVPYIQRGLVPDEVARRLAREILAIKRKRGSYVQSAQFCNHLGLKQISGRRWTTETFTRWCRAAENNFVLPNGSHEAAPIPPDAMPVVINTITLDE